MVNQVLNGSLVFGIAFVGLTWAAVRVSSNRLSTLFYWLASLVCCALMVDVGADWLGMLVVVLSSLQAVLVRIGGLAIRDGGDLPVTEQTPRGWPYLFVAFAVCVGTAFLFLLAMKRIPPWMGAQSSAPIRLVELAEHVSGPGSWAIILMTTLLCACILAGGHTFAKEKKN